MLWMAGVEVSRPQNRGYVRPESDPKPEALPQAGSGGDQDSGAPAQSGQPRAHCAFKMDDNVHLVQAKAKHRLPHTVISAYPGCWAS